MSPAIIFIEAVLTAFAFGRVSGRIFLHLTNLTRRI